MLHPKLDVVLPDNKDCPAERGKGRGNLGVALAVPPDLFPPELLAGLGLLEVNRAPVPEAPVDKHRGLAPKEDEVGPSRKPGRVPFVDEAKPVQDRTDSDLGAKIVSDYLGHEARPVFHREPVHGTLLLT